VPLPVHPHVRGEDFNCAPFCSLKSGSPPRAWGRPGRGRRRGIWGAVHPHVRGEDQFGFWLCDGHVGSPPRAWGRLKLIRGLRLAVRFTPTCVGKTYLARPPARRETVHPHVRGEDFLLHALSCKDVRFTPTCVGKTSG